MEISFDLYVIPIIMLFGLCFFSIFRKGVLIYLAIICVAIGMIFSGFYGDWIDVALVLMMAWGIVNIIRGEGR